MRHRIAEYEEGFLGSGTRAVCACGWKTRRCRDDQEARKAFAAHENETALTPADQGAARGAIKEMEANDAQWSKPASLLPRPPAPQPRKRVSNETSNR